MLWRMIMLFCLVVANAAPAVSQTTAKYRLEISYTWSPLTHPTEFPENGHMAKTFGVMHNQKYVLFKDGDTASSGLRLVAENGRNTILNAEFAEAQRRKRVGSVFEGPNAPTVPSSISVEFDVSAAHPNLSFVSMIAPSPDWFTGVSNVPLLQDGAWVEDITIPLWAWDAGSDNGETYLAKNSDTQPRQSVRLLTTRHFLDETGLRPVGYVVVKRIE